MSRVANLDTEIGLDVDTSSKDLQTQNEFFSLRSFIFSIVCQSPITVMEKLDIMFDITDMCSKFSDGIDFRSVVMIFNTMLRLHQIFLPLNELNTAVE